MGELTLVTGEADPDLRERLDEEINAFNAAATGYYDARLLSTRPAGTAETCAPGCTGGREHLWGFCGDATA